MKTSTPLVCCLSHYLTGLFAPGLTPASFRTRAAYLLRDLVDCQVVCFAELRRDTRQMDVDFDPYSPELNAALEGFGRHMAQYPCFNFDPDVAGGRPFLRGDFLSDEEFYASPIKPKRENAFSGAPPFSPKPQIPALRVGAAT